MALNLPTDRRPGELRRMTQPVVDLIAKVIRLSHWPILALFLLYLFSGLTTVKTDEVAVVLRFGRLVGGPGIKAIREPGFLFAFPPPIDEVVRVNVKRVHEVEVFEHGPGLGREDPPNTSRPADSIDPELDGYLLTGDRNVVHAEYVARYQVTDPVAYALMHADPHQLMRDVLMSATVSTVGEARVDDVLLIDRKDIDNRVMRRAQAELDEIGAGMLLVSIEFPEMGPPYQVIPAFNAVISALIQTYEMEQEALQYKRVEKENGKAQAYTISNDALVYSERLVQRAAGEANAFRQLVEQYEQNPEIVAKRLYFETIEMVLAGVNKTHWMPPPAGDGYNGTRLLLPLGEATHLTDDAAGVSFEPFDEMAEFDEMNGGLDQ